MMEKHLIEAFNLLMLLAVLSFPFLKIKGKAIITLGAVTAQTIIAFIVAFTVFANGSVEYFYPGSWITGDIPVRIDYLSAWFILIISFTFFTGSWYGFYYLKKYKDKKSNLVLHAISLLAAFTALIDICIIQNTFVFLVVWEIMALSTFLVVIFEHEKEETLKAGINYLIQSHICILLLTIAFIWVKVKTGSFDFNAIAIFTATQPESSGICLFLLLFCGFAIKAGFVPFHTWLPLAHPAAPAHISGIMSGVIIKIGIYGILRVLLLVKADMLTIGYIIMTFSVISGLYGVMLAIIQHNIKKLLAYHSIENIGIIGMGIGLGCIGIGLSNPVLSVCGFGGALLHTLNHSLFKSLLFFVSGNIYQATHTMDIEKLGGLIRKMPRSAYLFLIAALAICGLPPFNGFVSEFMIYTGLFKGLSGGNLTMTIFILFSIIGLVFIGGLALICFTKAFGIIFLGNPRENLHMEGYKEKPASFFSMYLVAFLILIIGTLPFIFSGILMKITSLYVPVISTSAFSQIQDLFTQLTVIGWYSLGFIILVAVLFFVRHLLTRNRPVTEYETWGCGYTGNAGKMQYTASSFIRTYRKLAEPVLLIEKHKKDVQGLYPDKVEQITHPGDKFEKWFIEKPTALLRKILESFAFLQNGRIQAYILYGIIFIGLVILLPALFDKFYLIIDFFNNI